MRKFFTLLVCLFLFISFVQAQQYSKLGSYLSERLKRVEFAQSDKRQALLVKGNPEDIRRAVEQYQGIFKFNAKNVCSIEIPYKNLKAFSEEKYVERIENSFGPGQLLMDTARVNNNIDKVHSGIAPLIQSYTGKNVVVGIIDGGIYFPHGDFRTTSGLTRIRNLWDQKGTGTAPAPYNYGADWDSTAINNGTCTHIPPSSDQGHGTNVAGIAAGNGLGATTAPLKAQYKGVAYDANLVVVRVDAASPDFLQKMADAVDYIYKKADALGMPCVINTSVGTYYGSHDGHDLATEIIENLLCEKKGRVLVAAAGNAADKRTHVSYPLNATDSLFTWFKYNASAGMVYFDFWADTNNFKSANFAIGCDNSSAVFLKRTKYYNIITDFNPPQGGVVQLDDSLFNGITKLGKYSIYASLEGGTYHVEFVIIPTNTTYLWRLQTKGTGQFDLWANKALIGTSDMQFSPLPGGFSATNYRFGDSLKTMVSSWQCSDKVITVGNYSGGHIYSDVDGISRNPLLGAGEVRQNLFPSSSWGPTRDGRQKPNITATGSTTIATGDSFNIALLLTAPANRLKVGIGGKHNRNGGTSMASPIVTGVVALYLEKQPTASYNEVMQAIQQTAKTDAFTGAAPNVKWGYGKIDAFKMLTVPVYGCKDPSSSNYNPAATIDTGGCAYNYTWNGTKSNNWNDPLNWTPNPVCCGPNSCDANVIIPAGTSFAPTIIYGDVQTGNVTIDNAATITIQNNKKLNVCKDFSGGGANAIVTGGRVVMNGTAVQNFSGISQIDTLELNNSAGYSISGTTSIQYRLIPKKGIFNTTGGTLKFLSTSAKHIATIDFSAVNTGSINGNIVAERWVPVAGKNQHYIASPLNNLPLSQWGASGTAGFVIPTSDCDETQIQSGSPYGTVFKNHEDQSATCALKGWESLTSGNADNARGYSVYLDGNRTLSVNGSPNFSNSYNLAGLSNTGWATHTSKQGRPMSAGWNLVGNPYLSIINLNPQPDFDAQVAIWQTSGPYTGTYQTLLMGTNAVIPAFQGFMVHKTAVGISSFTINRTDCINNPSTLPNFYKTGNDATLSITIIGNGFADKTAILFNENATSDFDPMFDANKIHSRLGQPTLYTLNGAEHMSINTLYSVSESNVVPLSIEPGANGLFTLQFDSVQTFSPSVQILLEDKVALTWTNIRQQPTYSFKAHTNDNWDRFAIHFQETATGIKNAANGSNSIEVLPNPFSKETIFRLSIAEKAGDLQLVIYNALGQKADKISIEQTSQTIRYENTKLATGIYYAVIEQNGKAIASQRIAVE
jgi:hypothetical protein